MSDETSRWANVAKLPLEKVEAGDEFTAEFPDGGHARKLLPEAGYVVTDVQGREIFIPAHLFPRT